MAGAIAGPLVTLDLRTLYLKDLQLLGCTWQEDAVFEQLLGYVARGELMAVLQLTQGFGRLHQHGGLLGTWGLGGGSKAGVSGFVHQFIELLRLADPHLEKPAGPEGV